MLHFSFPSPVAFHLGSWPVYWYGILFVTGAFLAWRYGAFCLQKRFFPDLSLSQWEGLWMPLIWGIVIGGRLGEVLLYRPGYYLEHPLEIFKTWQGGMSFHGGCIGCGVAVWIYARKNHVSLWTLGNLLALSAPIALGLGRLGNFLNQELLGSPTSYPWGMIFPNVDELVRHPLPLYEAIGEGLCLGLFLNLLAWKRPSQRLDILGLFCLGYGSIRFFLESFKDLVLMQEGTIAGLTYGQWYSLPLILGGLILWIGRRVFD